MGGCVSQNFIDSLKGAKCLLFGAGVTGAPTLDYLKSKGATVISVDEKVEGNSIKKTLEKEDLVGVGLAIVSPGWRVDHPLVLLVREAGIEIISEIDLAWRVKQQICPNQRWIGLTGTNGKTTTIQMLESMLLESGINAKACGNLGYTAIEAVVNASADILALELSSFQLEWSNLAHFETVAILNVAEDHIDWHQSFENYLSAKLKIAQLADLVILNKDDQHLAKSGKILSKPITWISLQVPSKGEIGLVENLIVDRAFITGDAEALFELSDVTPAVGHNVSNAMAAAALARSVGAKADAIASALRKFKLDSHRLEVVHKSGGITFINDSKATNPHAAIAALYSQMESIWIAGGLAKGAAMDELAQKCRSRIKAAILIGSDAPLIKEALLKQDPDFVIHTTDLNLNGIDVMRSVMRIVKEIAIEGDVVLLAPACASMDQFKNYADRGESFTLAAKEAFDE
ncbi:MAG: UDP-N-acetylmuramoyl-L-alanine--D-glutamate ligase [Actinobacteria bacterium]|nr:UDP-N-acetylmuramoyl-L-alanine--D-glutamate ligase [Actinomycetota bacterium]